MECMCSYFMYNFERKKMVFINILLFLIILVLRSICLICKTYFYFQIVPYPYKKLNSRKLKTGKISAYFYFQLQLALLPFFVILYKSLENLFTASFDILSIVGWKNISLSMTMVIL